MKGFIAMKSIIDIVIVRSGNGGSNNTGSSGTHGGSTGNGGK